MVVVAGFWFLVWGFWFMVSGFGFLVSGFRFLNYGSEALGCESLVSGTLVLNFSLGTLAEELEFRIFSLGT